MDKIYVSYAKKDYNTEYEKIIFEKITKIFGSHFVIVNPKDIKIVEHDTSNYNGFMKEMEQFFSEIKKCVILIAVPYSLTDNFTSGVLKEISFAKSNNIPVFIVITLNNL